jgi:sulfite reductase (NADPH) flavoprotein alpha-component
MTAIPQIPESAPFSPKQRAWLNGFFAGLVSTGKVPVSEAIPPSAVAKQPVSMAAVREATVGDIADRNPRGASWQDVLSDDVSQYPWHSAELPIEDRMELAVGKPLELRMMAAMAQLDCGQCGYLCRTYAKAIETGEDTDLKKCAPGGKKTARALIQLVSEREAPVGEAVIRQVEEPVVVAEEAIAVEPRLAFSRQSPFPAAATRVDRLTGDGSAKDVRLVSLSLVGSGLHYKVGDALGVFPKNSKEQVEAILRLIGADGSQAIRTPEGFSTTLRGALAEQCDLKTVSDELVQFLIKRASEKQDRKQLEKFMADEQVEGLIREPRVIDFLARFRNVSITGEELVKTLDSLKPRLYSIASSPKVEPQQVDLIVAVVRYVLDGQQRQGTASTFLANRMLGHEPVPVFVQPCHHFSLPKDPSLPVLMVGPGTGIAPFRAFLHERRAINATGENWLFFGEQHEATDFLLHDELREMQQQGILSRLSTAFSRDQPERIYVQNRLLEESQTVWQWLLRGAHFYICGDASRMAVDVERALHQVIVNAGGLTHDAAVSYVKEMAKVGRYQKDVY